MAPCPNFRGRPVSGLHFKLLYYHNFFMCDRINDELSSSAASTKGRVNARRLLLIFFSFSFLRLLDVQTGPRSRREMSLHLLFEYAENDLDSYLKRTTMTRLLRNVSGIVLDPIERLFFILSFFLFLF